MIRRVLYMWLLICLCAGQAVQGQSAGVGVKPRETMDVMQLDAYADRGEQLLRELADLWPWLSNPALDSALRQHVDAQVWGRFVSDAPQIQLPDGTRRPLKPWLSAQWQQVPNSTLALLSVSPNGTWQQVSPRSYQLRLTVNWQVVGQRMLPLHRVESVWVHLRWVNKAFGDDVIEVQEVRLGDWEMRG